MKVWWTEQEIQFLKDNHDKYSTKELAEQLGRSQKSVTNQKYRQGLIKASKKLERWTDEEIQFLKDNHKKMTDIELGEHLGRSRTSVRSKRNRLGLAEKREEQSVYEVYKGYVLKARGTARECAEQLGVSIGAIYAYSSPSTLERVKNLDNATISIKVDEEEVV